MKYVVYDVLIAALVVVGAGCERTENELAGAPISLVRECAERSCEIAVGSSNKIVLFRADLEYPSHYGISQDEFQRLDGFVNALFNGGTNFVTSVENASRDVFRGIREASTNENFDAAAELDMEVHGRVTYADARYFSYELSLRGLCADYLRCTYDRKLERVVTIGDIVSSNKYDRLRRCIREYLKLTVFDPDGDPTKGRPADWPLIKDTFTVNDSGITWVYSREELGLGAWIDVTVNWDELNQIVDPSIIPPGKFADRLMVSVEKDSMDWWQFPFERIDRMEFVPPNPPFAGTNYPHASVTLKIENPCQGGMTTRKFKALQKCLASAISPHAASECLTIRDAVHCELVHFWERLIKEWDGVSPESGYGIYELGTKVSYRGPEYVSFRIDSQDGCPCCAGSTNIVWNWRSEFPLRIEEVLMMSQTNELKRLMRQRVWEDLAEAYDDNPEAVLPEYAKGWPYSFENFSLDEHGVTWFCDAGEVIIGGKGSYGTTLSWDELMPFIREDFKLPSVSTLR